MIIPPNISVEALLTTFAKLVAPYIAAELQVAAAPVTEAGGEWLTTDEATSQLKMSKAKLLRMRSLGCPVHHCGQSPRWVLSEVRAWLDARGPKGAPSKPSGEGAVLKKKRGR
jgi:hypothetical protein